ncbi:uncharacterized protein [Spinacia oleracea]|uniref:Uncharacterized protein n=1 Tax=Spinacia oleracea TaxID=3562 RepID=A0ABM3RDC5_SPIOL|nr:uncharacterized protein LOC110791248 [Spinacia oleracea]XP_056693616.1 uncharacterized protein LOC110791248 [Spinacia oleracea]XP_056693617.1 uncharacterized protein LOC110791248 [Spinacia oleracea]
MQSRRLPWLQSGSKMMGKIARVSVRKEFITVKFGQNHGFIFLTRVIKRRKQTSLLSVDSILHKLDHIQARHTGGEPDPNPAISTDIFIHTFTCAIDPILLGSFSNIIPISRKTIQWKEGNYLITYCAQLHSNLKVDKDKVDCAHNIANRCKKDLSSFRNVL